MSKLWKFQLSSEESVDNGEKKTIKINNYHLVPRSFTREIIFSMPRETWNISLIFFWIFEKSLCISGTQYMRTENQKWNDIVDKRSQTLNLYTYQFNPEKALVFFCAISKFKLKKLQKATTYWISINNENENVCFLCSMVWAGCERGHTNFR